MTHSNYLKYKPQDMDPKGRSKVFFCCQEDDFITLFESVTNEILAHQNNTTIWYYDPREGRPEDEELFFSLSEMQMLVVPITSNFLFKKNHAREVEFKYAVEHNIPVLPLMREAGLEREFNRICGDLQFLDADAIKEDSTAIPYEERLKNYLNAILVNDELASKIRQAFDAYIFLSYRKKDRKYAQEIMRLIHSNEFCRDIAIWYDEFLTPGENFNNAIEEAMRKSKLFALVVTPNLLEENNYVMRIEYPEAKKKGMNVLPIEGVKTDEDILAEYYIGIDSVVNSKSIREKLHEEVLKMALEERPEDSGHTFLIGLAYLSGIDVEKDYKKAVQLITSAAELGLPEAYKKLSTMYDNGEGVEKNYDTASMWQKKYVDYLTAAYGENPKNQSFSLLIEETYRLGVIQNFSNKVYDAFDTISAYMALIEKLDDPSLCYDYSVKGYTYLSYLASRMRKKEEAVEWAVKKIDYINEAKLRNNEVRYEMDLCDAYGELGFRYNSMGAKEETRRCYDIAREHLEVLNREHSSYTVREKLWYFYERLSGIEEERNNREESLSWLAKSRELREKTVQETGHQLKYLKTMWGTIYDNIGLKYDGYGEKSEALLWYEKSYEVLKRIAEENNSINNKTILVDSLRNVASCYLDLGNYDEARLRYLKTIDYQKILEQSCDDIYIRLQFLLTYKDLIRCSQLMNSEEEFKWKEESDNRINDLILTRNCKDDLSSIAFFCNRVAQGYSREGKKTEAKYWYTKVSKAYETMVQMQESSETSGKLANAYDNIAVCCISEKNLAESIMWLEKERKIREEIAHSSTLSSLSSLAKNYSLIGLVHKRAGNKKQASGWFSRSVAIYERLLKDCNLDKVSPDVKDKIETEYNKIKNLV